MKDEIQKTEELPKNVSKQVDITDLLQLAQPLMDSYTSAQIEQKKQELDHHLKILQINSKQNQYLIIGLFSILFLVLLIAGYLFIQGRDNVATNLIQIVVALGAAAFGGYGWAISKKAKQSNEE